MLWPARSIHYLLAKKLAKKPAKNQAMQSVGGDANMSEGLWMVFRVPVVIVLNVLLLLQRSIAWSLTWTL